MGLHVGQLTGTAEMRRCFEAVTENGAKALNLEGYGIAAGKNADLIVLQAADPIEALRLRANRLQVIRRGAVIAESPAAASRLSLGNQSLTVDFTRP
jgi:cytosine deaminase